MEPDALRCVRAAHGLPVCPSDCPLHRWKPAAGETRLVLSAVCQADLLLCNQSLACFLSYQFLCVAAAAAFGIAGAEVEPERPIVIF